MKKAKYRRGEIIMMTDLVQIGSNYMLEEKIEKDSSFSNIKNLISLLILKSNFKKLDYRNVVEKNSSVLNGKVVIKGTRIPPKAIYEYFKIYCREKDVDITTFVVSIKKEYPSLKNKTEKTIIKSLLYYIASTSVLKLMK